MAVDQELNTKDVIEIDRRLWRNLACLTLYLASQLQQPEAVVLKRINEVIISPENYLSMNANDLTMI